MTPPGLTCATCDGLFLGAYARRTPAGWVHAGGCPDEPWHGTLGGYTNRRCRQACCRAAKAADARQRRRAARPQPDEPDDVDPMDKPGAWRMVRGVSRWVPYGSTSSTSAVPSGGASSSGLTVTRPTTSGVASTSLATATT